MSARQFERIRNFGGGADLYRNPIDLAENQSQGMVNVVVRDNYEARTRMGADPLLAGLPLTGPVRGLMYLDKPNGLAAPTRQLLAVTGGNVYMYNGAAWSAALAWQPSDAQVSVAAAQGVDKLLITDGVGNVQSYDGAAFTDQGAGGGTPDKAPPKGVQILCWSGGRMWASGHPQYPDTVFYSSLLDFTSGQAWDFTNQSFRVGGGDGDPIMALKPLPGFRLAAIKRNSVYLIDTNPTDMASLGAGAYAQQASEPVGSELGGCGRFAAATYQNDLLFMCPEDGIYSLQRMQAAAGQYQLTAPLSLPIQPLIDRINWNYMSGIIGTRYKQFVLFFVPLDGAAYNNAALVWNGRLQQWLGYWTGWTPTAVATPRFNGLTRLVFGDNGGQVNQWKDYASLIDDNTYKDNGVGYASELDTRSLIWGSLEAQKKLRAFLARFNGGNATVNFTCYGDLANDDAWANPVQPVGDILGQGHLPFQLELSGPLDVYRSLAGIPYSTEAYFKIQANTGWWALRTIVASAFLKPMATDA
ncbi:MAG: hypothetical protein KGL39_21255 [Patescibacteria group bacterium]|nr:hypothetical protein [Patescibacteria group bacterium]